ncbi:MAG: DEAD/DEAH box helicase, partial [Alphaproteobacteria bacterium]|nr:DEAD/DEAH box helicase [Alphaproteobacteria bacterium]
MPWPPDALKLAALPAAASDEHFELHLAAVEHEMSAPILIQSRADILSAKHWQEQIEPYEHQIRNLITFCRRAPVALIADDVGLGKTISAGLILNELQVRKKVRRALVLCPSVLIEQWAEELASKFGMPRIATGTGDDFDDNLRSSAPVVITTYETARDRMRDVARAGFDMVVLDEAHKLRNLTGSDEPPKLARAVFGALQQRAFRYVLMLTATPVQNRVWDIYSLVSCLAAAKGHQNPLGDDAAFRRKYLTDKEGRKLQDGRRDEFRRHIQDYMVRTSRLTAGLSFPQRLLQTLLVQPQSHEVALYERVGAAIAGLPKLAQFSIAEALLSSPRALHKQLVNMAAKGTIRDAVVQGLGPALAAVGPGCKLDHVLGLCRELAQREPRAWRCLVFTRRTETQELIADALRRQGVAVGLVRGGEAEANRKAIAAYRADPPQAHVIVSTDAGAVGLNLQAGNVVVNYDLPWNPMTLEQRIGRVQRIGSKFQNVLVWNLAVDGTVEALIVARLVEKLHAVAQTLGEVEGVLEAANQEDRFADDVGELVTQALMGADVRVALQKAQESIERAKLLYAAEQQAVEEHLGRLDTMHDAGPKAPQLAAAPPRLSAEDFAR